MLRSIAAKHLPQCELGLHRAETTKSASQLEAHLQASPAEQLPGKLNIVGQLACQVADGGGGFPNSSDPDRSAGAVLMPAFTNIMRIIPCAEFTVIDLITPSSVKHASSVHRTS